MNYCRKCGHKTMLMEGNIYLIPDDEPYESGVVEESKTGINKIDKYVSAHYCENCDEIVDIYNE